MVPDSVVVNRPQIEAAFRVANPNQSGDGGFIQFADEAKVKIDAAASDREAAKRSCAVRVFAFRSTATCAVRGVVFYNGVNA